jgi:hypothetical protein
VFLSEISRAQRRAVKLFMENSAVWVEAVRGQLELLTALADKQLETVSSSGHSRPVETLREILESQRDYFSSLLNMANSQLSAEDAKFHKILEASQSNQSRMKDEIACIKDRIAHSAPRKPLPAPVPQLPSKMVKIRAPISPQVRQAPNADLEELAGLQLKLKKQVQELQQIASSTASFALQSTEDPVKQAVTQRMSLDFANSIQFSGRPLYEYEPDSKN